MIDRRTGGGGVRVWGGEEEEEEEQEEQEGVKRKPTERELRADGDESAVCLTMCSLTD